MPRHSASKRGRTSGSRKRTLALTGGAAVVATGAIVAGFGGVANAGLTPSLTLNQPTAAAKVQPYLGQNVTFTAVLPKSAKNPVIIVDCFQNQVLVYEQRGAVNDTYLLGGTSSDWLTNKGSAHCVANAYNMVWNSKYQSYDYMALAVTEFDANG